MSFLKRASLMGAAIALVASATGCTTPSEASVPEPDPVALVIVTGNHEGNPEPAISGTIEPLVERALANEHISVVTGDGEPRHLSAKSLNLSPMGGTRAGNEAVIRRNKNRVAEALTSSPLTDGANTWAAISTAKNALSDVSPEAERVIVVIDNGLADRGVLNFAKPRSLEMDASDVVAQLEKQDLLLDLSGITVILSGFGAATGPQEPLTPKAQETLIDIWVGVLEASNAEVIVDNFPRDGESVDTAGKHVNPTPVPEGGGVVVPNQCESSESVFDGRSGVTFIGDTARFVKPTKAHTALQPLADWLREDPDRVAHIRGTTAGALTESKRIELGLQRAKAVAKHLQSRGVLSHQITIEGVGTNFAEYIPDVLPDGSLDESVAFKNRSIRVTLTDPCG